MGDGPRAEGALGDRSQGDPRGDGPLAGVRVLDLSVDRAGAVAAMLLADLGADVVRPTLAERAPDAADLGEAGRRRGTTPVVVGTLGLADATVAALVDRADVVLVDGGPRAHDADGLTAAALARRNEAAVIAWLPPNGEHGEAADLPAHPALLAARSGFAQWQSSVRDEPVVAAVPYLTSVHGALGAAAALAALVEGRAGGRGQVVAVSGLHAAALMLATVSPRSVDRPMAYTAPRDTRGSASYRLYRGADDRWFFLGALVPAMFIAALDAIDLLEVMVRPGIDGEFMNLYVGDNGRLVAEALEARFAEQPVAHWLDVLARAGVPAAAVATRAEWVATDTFTRVAGFVARVHPTLGPILVPASPFAMTECRVEPGGFVEPVAGVDVVTRWAAGAESTPQESPVDGDAVSPVLGGLRVLDLSTFVAGPTGAGLLGQWGAEVIKVEAPHGDPYRIYNVSYAAVNQGKRLVVLDLTNDEGRAALAALVAGADVLVDNLRPALRAKLGLTTAWLHEANPRLVHATLTAFGDDGALADAPGFDPIIQACSGLMDACGDEDGPYYTSTPVHDVAAATLIALGSLAALWARDRLERGPRVAITLAGSSTLVQGDELICRDVADLAAPRPALDDARLVRVRDGWIAIAGAPDERADAALVPLDRPDAVAALRALGVAAAAVVERDEVEDDPDLLAHQLLHTVLDDQVGACLVVDQVASWSRSVPSRPTTAPPSTPDPPHWPERRPSR